MNHQPNADNCCVAWAQAEDGLPLLCIAGSTALIQIINSITGELLQVRNAKKPRDSLILTFDRFSQAMGG